MSWRCDDVSRSIANGIRVRLTPQEEVRLASAHPVNPEAYQSYLRGLYFWNKLTPDSAKLAVNYFQTAIEKDPGYAPAYASLANCYSLGYLLLDLTPREAYPRARTAATKAAALDENLAEAQVALGDVSEMGWDWCAAEHEFRRAIQLDPNRSYAHLAYGFLLLILHKRDDAWTELKTAQSLDPVSQVTGFRYCCVSKLFTQVRRGGHRGGAVASTVSRFIRLPHASWRYLCPKREGGARCSRVPKG